MVSFLVHLRGSALISYVMQLQCLRGLVIGLKSKMEMVKQRNRDRCLSLPHRKAFRLSCYLSWPSDLLTLHYSPSLYDHLVSWMLVSYKRERLHLGVIFPSNYQFHKRKKIVA